MSRNVRGLSVPPMSMRFGGAFALLALLGSMEPLDANDGPIIGVQIASGSEVMLDIVIGQGGLRIEWPGGRKELPGGTHRLELTEKGAAIGGLDFGRTIPFRFRAEVHSTRVGDGFYEGWLEVLVPEDGRPWRLVNRLPLERYLLGVVPGEMPADTYPRHALGAQAVASRTYALFHILTRPKDARIHVHADDRSQVYLGGGAPHPRVVEAVEQTHGQVLLYDGKVFESFYHSTCGGATRGVEDWFGGDPIPPLSSVACGGCSSSKYYNWEARLSEVKLREALAPICRRHRIILGELHALEPVDPAPGGHCAFFRVRHAGGSFEVDADRLRRACSTAGIRLRSTSFFAERKGDEFTFFGRGWGHGVGLCQVGAKGYAEQDARYRWILEKKYYPGSEISKLWN